MPIIALRDNALTTLAALKDVLGVAQADTTQDTQLIRLINQASADIERALGRKLRRDDYVETLKGSGGQQLLLTNYPLRAVEYIHIAGEVVPPAMYDCTSDADAGIIYKDDGWTYSGYPHGLTGDLIAGSRNIEVSYTAGYILPGQADDDQLCDLPDDLVYLAQQMCRYRLGLQQSGGTAGLKSLAIGDVRWEWSDKAPDEWQDIIDHYRRRWI